MHIADRVEALLGTAPTPGMDYYALTISLGSDGALEYGCQTHWVGYTDEEPRREIRRPRLVSAERFLENWKAIDEPGMVVNTPDDFALFFAYGGNALVVGPAKLR